MRVAAVDGLGARYLADDDEPASSASGSGGMARSFAQAFAAERPLKTIKAYSPNRSTSKPTAPR